LTLVLADPLPLLFDAWSADRSLMHGLALAEIHAHTMLDHMANLAVNEFSTTLDEYLEVEWQPIRRLEF
jgi:hypothetical protein